MSKEELLEIADYIIDGTAKKASEMLYERLSKREDWISQTEARNRYGRTTVEKLLIAGKVKTRPNGNRIEYNLSDLIQNTTKKLIINKVK